MFFANKILLKHFREQYTTGGDILTAIETCRANSDHGLLKTGFLA